MITLPINHAFEGVLCVTSTVRFAHSEKIRFILWGEPFGHPFAETKALP